MAHQSKGCELVFEGVNVSINKRDILRDVAGRALPGEMLAVMGPSGESGNIHIIKAVRMLLAAQIKSTSDLKPRSRGGQQSTCHSETEYSVQIGNTHRIPFYQRRLRIDKPTAPR